MKLQKQIKLIYALPALFLAVVGIPVYVYLPKFYTDTLGVSVTAMGIILLSVRVLDAVTDPLIGVLSDRTESRFGRRKPYMFAGIFFLSLFLFMLFSPIPDLASYTLYFTVVLALLFLFWTIVTVPYESLGIELTTDYNERTGLFAFRDGLLILGTLLAASSPIIVRSLFLKNQPSSSDEFRLIALIYIPLLIGSILLSLVFLKEKKTVINKTDVIFPGSIFKNRPFIILLSAYTISAFGNNLPATLILYYVEYVLGGENAELFLLLYFLFGIAFLPLWKIVSEKIGKKITWITAMLINSIAFFFVFFLGSGDLILYGILVCVSGIGFGATLVLPSSIQADVVDYDELLSGTRREGAYIGFWSVSKKLAAALGVGIALGLLGTAGYEPNIEQSEYVVLTLRTLYAAVPSLLNIFAVFIISFYPLNKKNHSEILIQIEKRKKKQQWYDPIEREN
jgi:GPH family glycoside/pentoside/hexuronide:cation symporter